MVEVKKKTEKKSVRRMSEQSPLIDARRTPSLRIKKDDSDKKIIIEPEEDKSEVEKKVEEAMEDFEDDELQGFLAPSRITKSFALNQVAIASEPSLEHAVSEVFIPEKNTLKGTSDDEGDLYKASYRKAERKYDEMTPEGVDYKTSQFPSALQEKSVDFTTVGKDLSVEAGMRHTGFIRSEADAMRAGDLERNYFSSERTDFGKVGKDINKVREYKV